MHFLIQFPPIVIRLPICHLSKVRVPEITICQKYYWQNQTGMQTSCLPSIFSSEGQWGLPDT